MRHLCGDGNHPSPKTLAVQDGPCAGPILSPLDCTLSKLLVERREFLRQRRL
jgi:hypothetical protein